MKNHRILLTLVVTFALLAGCIKDTPKRPVNFDALEKPSGCEGVQYDDWENSPYVLPYPVGKTYAVNLSHCGGSYHAQGEPDQFAIDFDMGFDAEVTAAMDGIVIFVEESGLDGAFPNNVVVLRHEDQSHTQYMHLTYQGALVSVGQFVRQGDVIGLTGATGLAGYPHLHFVATGGKWQFPYNSIPTTFRNTAANPRSLESGKNYTAMPY